MNNLFFDKPIPTEHIHDIIVVINPAMRAISDRLNDWWRLDKMLDSLRRVFPNVEHIDGRMDQAEHAVNVLIEARDVHNNEASEAAKNQALQIVPAVYTIVDFWLEQDVLTYAREINKN